MNTLRPSSWGVRVLVATLGAFLITYSFADEKKPPAAKQPPRVLLTLPLSVARSTKSVLTLRGQSLDTASEVHAEADGRPIHVEIKTKGKADLPKDIPPEKVGDTKVEVEIEVPAEVSANEIKVVVVTPTGSTEPRSVRILDARSLTLAKKPNNGFRNAQEISLPTNIQGAIGQENEVHVFRVTGKGGEQLKAEVWASRLGSSLDSLLTLYDPQGHVIASNDDDETSDSLLQVMFPRDGSYFLGITDANGKGGATSPYLLYMSQSK